jgi:hypothetical protein
MTKNILRKTDLFLYNNEYQVLEIAGVLCGLLIIGVTNKFFFNSSIYYFLFFFGLGIGSLGFIIEYLIKTDKKKTIDREFNYFLADLGREFKKTNNMALCLKNISESNFYGSINRDIKKISTKVSWGMSFEDSLRDLNKNIKSNIISHCLALLEVLKNTSITYDQILLNLSKDTLIFKSEKNTEKYFSNLFNLSIFFYLLFVFLLLFVDFVIGYKFMWFSIPNSITRLFLSTTLLYLALCMSFFTSFVMCVVKQKKPLHFFKYVLIFFIITVMLFQTFIPRPDAEDIIIDGINYLSENNSDYLFIEKTIGIKSISSKEIIDNTDAKSIYFINTKSIECLDDCIEYTIILDTIVFLSFEIYNKNNEYTIYYEII